MKKFLAFMFALISGLYLLTMGVWVGPPDFIPILDEATALLIFVKSLAVLGIDLSRFVPFLGKKPRESANGPSPVVDV